MKWNKDLTDSYPLVSLLVAAWNEEHNIHPFLNSFLKLAYSNKELILIAGGDDKTYARASSLEHPQIILLEQQKGEGKFRALKRGLNLAKGSIIYLTDADCRLTTEVFFSVVEPIIKEKESIVTGRFRPLEAVSYTHLTLPTKA